MFKKAQLKLFAFITAILLAIFIAVLGSVNIIMQAVMQRQSKDVLQKIAAGVEYDEKTSRFNITRPENFGQKPAEEPPSRPDGQPGSDFVPPETTQEDTTSQDEPDTTEALTEGDTTTTSETVPTETTSLTTTTSAASTTTVTTTPKVTTTEVTVSRKHTTEPPTVTTQKRDDDRDKDYKEPDDKKDGDGKKDDDDKNGDNNDGQMQPPWWWWGQGDQNGEMPTFPQFQPPQWGDGSNMIYPPFWNWGGGDNNNSGGQNGDNGSGQGEGQQMPAFGFQFPYYGGNEGGNGCQQENSDQNKELSASPEELYGTLTLLGADAGEVSEPFEVSDIGDGGRPPMEQRNMEDNIPRSLGTIDFFILMADKEGSYIAQLNNEDLDSATAQKYISAILKENASSGMIDDKYQFYQQEKDNGTIIVFTDKSAEINMLSKLIRTTILIGSASLILLAVAAFFLSRQVMKPLKSAFEKQKQFISDASHELKTPLTVISTNADVLSDEIGENRWLNYIKSQTDRMNILVNDLLNLTRLENNTTDFIRTDFDLSKAVVNTALPFECQAFDSNKQFDVDVEEGLTVNGSERHIKQMAAIFIDNALKYSGDGGKVKVTLRKQGDKKVLTVFNTGQGVKEGEEEKIFERFYRSDESRNRSTGGYGLGLAIAKSIIDRHKFKVHVENDEGRSIAFIVTM